MSHAAAGAVATKEARPASEVDRLAQAFAHFRAARLADAEEACREIVQDTPEYGPAWHLLGLIAFRSGQSEIATGLLRRALALSPSDATILGNLGMVLQATGSIAEAEDCLERAIALNPGYPEALTNLGNLRLAQSRPQQAAELHRRAIAARPGYAQAHCNLGIALYASRLSDASEAEESFKRALALHPNFAEAHNNLGLILQDQKRPAEALARFRRALELNPNYAEAHNNLGFALESEGRMAEAGGAYERAVHLKPEYAEAHNNLGGWWQWHGQLERAMRCFERALALKPEFAVARYNRALLLLLRGDLEGGFRDYEARRSFLPRPNLPMPRWRGEPLAGQRILLHAEQGLGDAIQFLRYAPLVADAGGEVVLQVPEALARLAESMPQGFPVWRPGEDPPECAWECPLVSLPLAFGTRLDSIPARTPYLHPPADARRKADALQWPASAFRVGLVWAGNPSHRKDGDRSIPLRMLESLFAIAGAQFFSLQMGPAAAEATRTHARELTDLSPHIADLAETAALLQKLDLVLSVDTAVAHLAGALGIPTWVLLPFAPDWRWMLNRADTPWYPSMRLFRQPRPGDWPSVIEALRESLATEAAREAARSAPTAHLPPDEDSA